MKPVLFIPDSEIYTVYAALWNRYRPVPHYEINGMYCGDAPLQGIYTVHLYSPNTVHPYSCINATLSRIKQVNCAAEC